MRIIIPLIGFFLIPIFVNAAELNIKKEIAICAAKESDAERLICYDKLAKKLGIDKSKSKSIKGKGKWQVRKSISPIDDSTNVYLYLNSEEPVKSGYKIVRPSLYIRCKENKTDVYLNWNLYLGLDTTKMLTRFDSEPAYTSTWSISTDTKAVFVRGNNDISFAKKMMEHSKLLVQITPYGENPVMATFDIKGLKEAINPLREACHW